uniref:EB domain-containing protein n=1 Tax=Steinernema glaseri TaxID=37863 RepID=A0A1I8AIM7_9BILA
MYTKAKDYLLTTNTDSDRCSAPLAVNVTDLLAKPCEPEIGDCDLLTQIVDYCIFVGPEIANCVSLQEHDMNDISCPAKEERVDMKGGKAVCCPQDSQLVEYAGESPVCCPMEDGVAFCCPATFED